jgi:hypothetical protein
METKPLQVYSEASNLGIVCMPGRRFPGCVVQGDSLSGLLHLAEVVLRESSRVENELLQEAARELYGDLKSRLDHYEQVLTAHGMELPYVKRQTHPEVQG